jgi:uncharacterized protein
VIGVDPGIRTGCKIAVLDATGKFLENTTIYPGQGAAKDEEAKRIVAGFAKKYEPFAFAVGNGTAGRETESFVKKTLAEAGLSTVLVVPVSEVGRERVLRVGRGARGVPRPRPHGARGDLDRPPPAGPARRAGEDRPEAIGVGQYQHDVHQPLLAASSTRSSRAA